MILPASRYESRAGAGPMWIASSHSRTCIARASASEYTAIDLMPIARQVRAMRTAISPRFAISSLRMDLMVCATQVGAFRGRRADLLALLRSCAGLLGGVPSRDRLDRGQAA